jgi:hypothetical protein
MNYLFSTFFWVILLLCMVLPAAAEEPEPGYGRGRGGRWSNETAPPPPFGGYCPRRHADHYGASQPLRTPEEARDRLGQFFNRPAAQILLRKELRRGYIADITNPDGSLFDRVIIDMRTGRIRSIR